MTATGTQEGEAAARVQSLIALGSNLGDRRAILHSAIAQLAAEPQVRILKVSGLYETAPVGGPDGQGAFFNAALLALSPLSAPDMLALLHRIEAEHARERRVHWGPRTLDLDLLMHGSIVTCGQDLCVPHPRMHKRGFVMVPVCDIAPNLVHPKLARSMRGLKAALPEDALELELVSANWCDDLLPATEQRPETENPPS